MDSRGRIHVPQVALVELLGQSGVMDAADTPFVLVVVAGPQASGKSTLAAALGAQLREDGETVALIELDQIAAMALPTLPSWEAAHQIFESVTGMWARAGLTCVIAEGSGTQDEISRLLSQAPPNAATITVVTTTPFEVAFDRAQADPTRGISKDRAFLSGVYEHWSDEITQIDADVVIDTNAVPVTEAIERIRVALTSARGDGVLSH